MKDNIRSEEVVEDTTTYFFKMIIAGKKIEVECLFRRGFARCKTYMANFDEPDFVIRVSRSELLGQLKRILENNKVNLNHLDDNTEYGDLESTIVYIKIAEAMLSNDFLLMHGAAIAVNGKCYIFTAPSGTGKTTHIRNWLKMISGSYVVNGDKPLIDVKNKIVHGTPWCGKEGMNTNTAVPLAGIILLERGVENDICSLRYKDMLPTFLEQIYIPEQQELAMNAYRLIGELKEVPCYRLRCNMNEDSAVVAYEGLCQQ